MIDKALKNLFGVVAEEAGANRAFGRKLEDALIKFGADLHKQREIEEQIESFSPFVEFKQLGADGLTGTLKNRSVAALKQIVARHNVDPAGALGGRPSRADLVTAIVNAAEKRAKRDARLFEY